MRVWLRLLRWLAQPGSQTAPGAHRHQVRVVRRTAVAVDGSVVAFEFERPDGSPLPSWQPGAHIDVTLPSGRYRQYSLCGDLADRTRYRIAVRRIEGGGSAELHDEVAEGTMLTVGTPRNAFPLAVGGGAATARPVRFIAGGIGITPILPSVTVAACRPRTGRASCPVWSARMMAGGLSNSRVVM
ncbi:hypothetical protein EBN03_23525 [Nocardia stercoris]|uniref:FAD-binding FR-type domain-containing protein n=2 Tax=Nocardia stercoris TaxID=2483361 RepID=A0A3M2KY90_9NOCA|nr:hypothetical protein EBN03_23525 [Nocardia stercoris]